jgi:catechol 2,3-dioxygenase-like lactoylglutathione lyase family enzyme
MMLDHIGLNVSNLEVSIDFYRDWFGLQLIQQWDEPRQAFVGNAKVALGLMEVSDYDFQRYTTAHLAFAVDEEEFAAFAERLKAAALPIVAGPKPQRGGETVLFRDPSGNIVEVCYPSLTEWRTTLNID